MMMRLVAINGRQSKTFVVGGMNMLMMILRSVVVLQSLWCWKILVVSSSSTTTNTTSSSGWKESSLLLQQCFVSETELLHHPDYVTSIPGYNAPTPTPWFSGYLTYEFYNRTVHTHYTFVLAEDNEDATKPIIYWSNGGPGASSLFGLLTELGPLLLSDLSLQTEEYHTTGIPTPIYNPYSWTRLGHILTFDQPAPIGFSYCNNATTSHSCDGIAWTDELTSQNAIAALLAFRTKFSCLSSLDIYLTGESYGGIYIPTFAREIIRHNNKIVLDNNNIETTATTTTVGEGLIPLKGFAVGDGCLGTETDICGVLSPSNPNGVDRWLLLFLAGHHQIPLDTYRYVLDACASNDHDTNIIIDPLLGNSIVDATRTAVFRALRNNNNNNRHKDDGCKIALQKVQEQVGYVYDYGLYDECTYSNGLLQQYVASLKEKQQQQQQLASGEDDHTELLSLTSYRHDVVQYTKPLFDSLTGAVNDYPCGGDIVMEQLYLNLTVVQEAFHLQSTWFSVDNAGGDFDYTPTEPDLTQTFYYDLITNNLNATTTVDPIKVLIYNGDTDPAITSFAAHNWTSKLGFPTEEEWRPWTVDNCRRIGGYITRYAGHFHFLTIRGAGHMVPTNKAAAAFTFLKSWIEDKSYPVYNKDCVAPPK